MHNSRKSLCSIVLVPVLVFAPSALADPFFKVSANGGNSCGFWGSGFSESGPAPVSDQQSFFDGPHPAFYRYTASADCHQFYVETEIDWTCNCGSLCGENNGTSMMLLNDVVITGPPGATAAYFRISMDLTVPTIEGFNGGWRLRVNSINPANIDTGDQVGALPKTRLVSGMASWNVNTPLPLQVILTAGIRAADQNPQARAEALAEFPNDAPFFSFFDSNGIPVEGFSAHSAGAVCPRGDMNCDQVVNLADVPGFVAALLNPISSSLCNSPTADTNIDGHVDGLDINSFVTCLLGGACP